MLARTSRKAFSSITPRASDDSKRLMAKSMSLYTLLLMFCPRMKLKLMVLPSSWMCRWESRDTMRLDSTVRWSPLPAAIAFSPSSLFFSDLSSFVEAARFL